MHYDQTNELQNGTIEKKEQKDEKSPKLLDYTVSEENQSDSFKKIGSKKLTLP